MRTVLAMAMKDLRLMSRDWLGLFFIVGFPILMGIFFGSMYGGVGGSGSASLRVAVVDEDRIQSVQGSSSPIFKTPATSKSNRSPARRRSTACAAASWSE